MIKTLYLVRVTVFDHSSLRHIKNNDVFFQHEYCVGDLDYVYDIFSKHTDYVNLLEIFQKALNQVSDENPIIEEMAYGRVKTLNGIKRTWMVVSIKKTQAIF